MKNTLLICLTVLVLLGRAQAQVPNLVNYQGRISVGTTNFTGTGQFRFALTNSDGSTFYWTNDGSGSPSGQQPVNYVSVTVTKGLYSVLLGDTSLPNMTAIPTSVWSNPDVRLRVYFSDGTNSSQALSPDQRLAPTGYLASGLTLAGTPTFAGDLNLPATTSAATGVLDLGGSPFLHAYGANGLSSGNTFAGSSAGNFTLSGTFNTGAGYQTLAADTSGSFNTASGATALKLNTTGNGNTAAGYQALLGNTAGSNNSAVGNAALSGNTTAGENVAFGTGALQLQSFANGGTAWNSLNVAVGYQALYSNQPTATTNGINNAALGGNALFHNTTGTNNIGLGNNGGFNLTTGSNNIDIGSPGVAGETGIIRLGDGSTQTATYLTGIVNNSGLLTTVSAGPDMMGTTSVDSSLGLRLMNSAGSGSISYPNVTGIAFGQNSTRQAIVGETYGNDGLDFYVSGNLTTPVVRINANGVISGNGLGLFGLTSSSLVAGSVTSTQLAANSVTSSSLAAGSVTNTKLAANSVTANNIVSGTVGSTQLASDLTLGGATTIATDLNLLPTSSATTGVLNLGGYSFLHAYGGQGGVISGNTFLGASAGNFTLTGQFNTGLGLDSLNKDTSGSYNIGLGYNAGGNLTTGSNNIDIGNTGVAGETGIIRLGDGSTQTDTYLTGILHAGSTTAGLNLNGRTGIGAAHTTNDALYVQRFASSEIAAGFVSESGVAFLQVGTNTGYALIVNKASGLIARTDASSTWDVSSDERIKHDIRPVAGALATLERLRPVRFHYNADFLAKSAGAPDYERFGVVAQEFQKVFPDFVDTNADGMLSVRMDPIPIVTAAAVQELDAADKQRDATGANLQAENAALKKQVAQMQADDKDRDARLARLEKLLPTP